MLRRPSRPSRSPVSAACACSSKAGIQSDLLLMKQRCVRARARGAARRRVRHYLVGEDGTEDEEQEGAEHADDADKQQQPQRGQDRNEEGLSVWEVLWKDGGGDGQLQRIQFESTSATRAFLHKHVETWSASVAQSMSELMRPSSSGMRSPGSRLRAANLHDRTEQ